jgi:hypothetical protein
MNFLEKSKLNAEKINFEETQNYLKALNKGKSGKIISQIPTIHGIDIEFGYDFDCFSFKTEKIVICDNPSQYQQSNYGILEPFSIKTGEKIYDINYGAKSSSLHFKSMTISGKISKIEHNFSSNNEDSYFRAILPLDGYAKPPLQYFLGRGILNGESIKVAGYIDLKINQNNIGFYDYKINEQNYLVVECKTKTSIETFENLFEAIIHSFALISGNLLRNYITILKFQESNFSNIQGFKFERLDNNIITSLEVYNAREHKFYYDLKEIQYFPINIFSNLCELSYNSKPLLRAIRTLTQARNQPVEIETAAFFITLETVKQIIIEENIEKIAPFKDKKYANRIVKELRNIVKPLSDDEFNDKEAVIRKIENINSIGNADAFKLAFELVGIQLSNDDQECIKNRNKFLHGNIPYDHESKENRKKELSIINLNAHLITCSLILKYAGYKGPIKNFLKYLDIVNDINSINQPLFRII